MSYLSKLVNKSILSVNSDISESFPLKDDRTVQNYSSSMGTFVQLNFDDYTLNIYNPGKLIGVKDQSFKQLEKKRIINIEENDIEVILYFEGEIKLKIDIRPESFTGDEAMCLYGPNDLIVVWN